jgi:hypothetical protein
VSALAAGEPAPAALAPYWLAAADRVQLGALVRDALADVSLHPVAAIHLEDVLTELHVAAARDAVWPASSARVRSATGWAADVLPVRLSAAELSGILALPGLPAPLRVLLDAAGSEGTWPGATWPAATWPAATWPDATWPDATWPGATWPGATWPGPTQ